jgi:uncharacterized LabA/DUF88 family protein
MHKVSRSEITLDGDALVAHLRAMTDTMMFLRAYVYDGAWSPGHPKRTTQEAEHGALSATARLRLRLGSLRERDDGLGGFQQKGVDTLLVLDMLQMAQQGAYDVALLLAGDADFVEVVDAVQRLGRQVFLVGPPETRSLSRALRDAADDQMWDARNPYLFSEIGKVPDSAPGVEESEQVWPAQRDRG